MSLYFDMTLTVAGVDVSGLVPTGCTIDYGRPTKYTGFQAPIARFTMLTEATFPNYSGTWPTVDLGDEVIIHVTWDGLTQWRRFTGVVQALDWNPSGLSVTCTGTSTDWQYKTAGDTNPESPPYIEVVNQLDTERVDYLCDDAGVSITIEGVPARRVRKIPPYTPGQPLLDGLLRVADDCDGLVMEDRLGVVHYRTRNFDRPAPYTLPSNLVQRDSLDMAYERGSHVNTVRVYYGEPDEDTGNQLYVNMDDAATYGTSLVEQRLAELPTDLQYERAAEGKARVFLEKNRLAWEIPDVVLLMNQATGAQADEILDLQENWMVEVQDLPPGCPISSYSGDVLGMTDILGPDDYRIVLHLGPRIADTGAAPEEPIFDADSITGGTKTTYEDENGFLWELHTWTTPGTYTATVNSAVSADVLVVGGGGGGASTGLGVTSASGGGGAGTMFEYELELTPGTVAVAVGAGGVQNTAGGDSGFAGVTCYGGGQGGLDGSGGSYPGASGGSGGGGAGRGTAGGAGTGGTGSAANAFWYSDGQAGSGTVGGNGGGAAVQGTGNGQNGRESSITGTTVRYGIGGKGGRNNQITYTPAVNTGSGGNGGSGVGGSGTPGKDGIVVVRYRIG